MESVTANTSDELLAALVQIDISVPLRTGGRTTEHCERWSICRFLATFADSELIPYPLTVIHRDKPDFLLEHPSGECGIEVTEIVAENDAAIHAYREHHDIDGLFFLQRHRPYESKLRGTDLKDQANSNESSDAWVGDSVEREWVQAIQAFVQEKTKKSGDPGFDLFGQNWLLMYDNWSLPALDQESAAKMLFSSMNCDANNPFGHMFVDCSNQIWVFSPAGVYSRPINDLWAGSEQSA